MLQKNKKTTLLRYWTSRYLATLLIGLAIIFLLSAIWIRHTAFTNRIEMMTFLAEETVYRLTDTTDKMPNFIDERGRLQMREIDPILYIADADGNILTSNRPMPPDSIKNVATWLEGDKEYTKVSLMPQGEHYLVKKPIYVDEALYGWVLVLEDERHLTQVNQAYGQLALLIGALAVLGWGAIYFLSRRLAAPIKQVADAAKQIQGGNYDVYLPENNKEQEVDELVTSFKEMATKLEQLEKTRTELLAGVTHELKTPVTSISGLLQAVNDGVVTGDEAQAFIQMALQETTKMKTMVGDLLAFNRFAVDALPVHIETIYMNEIVRNIVQQWELLHEKQQLVVHYLEPDAEIQGDVVRLQQILTNLLTNAEQAIEQQGTITITIEQEEKRVIMTIQDTGKGILPEDQPFIFERFYRGENKKYAVRGLGLGLSLSKMMAQSIGGDLQLINSSEAGTSFEITLVKAV